MSLGNSAQDQISNKSGRLSSGASHLVPTGRDGWKEEKKTEKDGTEGKNNFSKYEKLTTTAFAK